MEIHHLPINKLNLLMPFLNEPKLLIENSMAHLFCLIWGSLVFAYLFVDL